MDIVDYPLDYYIDQIEEQQKLNELDPITITGIVGLTAATLIVAGKVISYLVGASAFRNSIKIDKPLSKRVNKILSSGTKWKAHTFPDSTPNAFAIGGDDVYITTGLKRILTNREQDAVLLHEVYHNKDLHIWKSIAAESSFIYLIVFVAITSAFVFGHVLALLIFLALKGSSNIAYKRIVGRRHEIKADEYAVKYGYGDDLISALNKLEKWISTRTSGQKCDKFCQLQRDISEAIDEHPSNKKRIEIILRKSKELNQVVMSGNFKQIQNFVTGVFQNNG